MRAASSAAAVPCPALSEASPRAALALSRMLSAYAAEMPSWGVRAVHVQVHSPDRFDIGHSLNCTIGTCADSIATLRRKWLHIGTYTADNIGHIRRFWQQPELTFGNKGHLAATRAA